MYQEIRCPNCHYLLIAEEIDLSLEKGYCPECKEAFSLKSVLDYQIRLKNEIQQPEHFDVLVLPDNELDITYRFRFVKGYPRLNDFLFKLMAGKGISQGCLILFFLPALFVLSFDFDFSPLWTVLIFAGTLLIIRQLWIGNHDENKIFIHIKNNLLEITNPKSKLSEKFQLADHYQINCNKISQMYVSSQQEKPNAYRLEFRLDDDTIISPFYPFIDIKDALYIEQMIEEFLRIRDQRDQNEIRI